MKNLLLCSPWNNKWLGYYEKFFASRYDIRVYHNDFGFVRRSDVSAMVEEHKLIEWADIILFNWTDPFLEYWSKQPKKDKKYIAFCRSYELFNTTCPWVVDWDNVDHLIFVNEEIRNIFLKNVENNTQKHFATPTHFIPNAVDLTKWPYRDRQPNGKIAWVGGMNYKKGVQLLLQVTSALSAKNNGYHIYPVGDIGDLRTYTYFIHCLEEFGIKNDVAYYHYEKDISKFLEDKSYILLTSLVEGHPNCIIEAMSVGIKPVIHNFPGSKDLFPKEFIWNTIDEAIAILEDEYNSSNYRTFIEENYDMERIYPQIENLF